MNWYSQKKMQQSLLDIIVSACDIQNRISHLATEQNNKQQNDLTNMLRMAGQRAANKVNLYYGVWIELKFVYSQLPVIVNSLFNTKTRLYLRQMKLIHKWILGKLCPAGFGISIQGYREDSSSFSLQSPGYISKN